MTTNDNSVFRTHAGPGLAGVVRPDDSFELCDLGGPSSRPFEPVLVEYGSGSREGVGRDVVGDRGDRIVVTVIADHGYAASAGGGDGVRGGLDGACRCPVRPAAPERAVTYTLQSARPGATAIPRPTPRLAPGLGVGARAVAAHDLHPGVLAQPGFEGVGTQ